jgi:hypothetical protein
MLLYFHANSTALGPIIKWALVKGTFTKYKKEEIYNTWVVIVIKIIIIIITTITIIIIFNFEHICNRKQWRNSNSTMVVRITVWVRVQDFSFRSENSHIVILYVTYCHTVFMCNFFSLCGKICSSNWDLSTSIIIWSSGCNTVWITLLLINLITFLPCF